jgi:hypothetical protein
MRVAGIFSIRMALMTPSFPVSVLIVVYVFVNLLLNLSNPLLDFGNAFAVSSFLWRLWSWGPMGRMCPVGRMRAVSRVFGRMDASALHVPVGFIWGRLVIVRRMSLVSVTFVSVVIVVLLMMSVIP